MRTGVGNDYKQLLSFAIAAVLISAIYAPLYMPFPNAMATPAAIEITNQTTCEALPAEEVTVEWIEPNVCRIVSGTLLVDEGIILRVASGVVLEITSSGTVVNNDGEITNQGHIINDGNFTNIDSGTMDNDGTFTNTGTVFTNVDSTGAFDNNAGGMLLNQEGGQITIAIFTFLSNHGNFTNYGEILNHGFLDNFGTLNNSGTISTDGTIWNYDDAVLNNLEGGLIDITGDEDPLLNNEDGGTINNPGTITNAGTIDNDGAFNNQGTIENECDAGMVLGNISGNQPEDGCSLEGPASGSISGFKFEDEDGDGEWDTGEVGDEGALGGVEICAFGDGMEVEVCDVTDPETGEYLLEDLPLDVPLEVYEEVPEGYEQTAPQDFEETEGLSASDGSYFITLDSVETVEDLNFGNRLDENSLPVANAGPDQTVDEGASVQLNGTNSSDEETDSDDLEYAWTQVSGQNVTLAGANTASPTFTAPSNVNTVLVFSLTVSDGTDNSAADTVSITVQGRGDITIKKVEQGTGDLLAGSAFTITPNPLTLTGSLVVADNGDDDSDPAAGIIKIQSARFSTYTIVESQVPAGYAKIVNSLTVVVNSGNLAPIATVQNLNVEQDIEETVEVPPPQLDEEQVDNLGNNGATVNGQPVNSTNLPPAVIVPSGTAPPAPQPVIFNNNAPPNTNGSALFTSFNIPTYQPPTQSIANQNTYAPPAFVIPKDDGSNFVLTPIIEEVFEEMTMQLTPPASTATSLTSIQSVEIEFGQGGSGIGFSFDLSSEIPEGLPEIEDIEETALFLDVDFVGNINFSNPDAFASPPAITMLVSRSLDGETLPDGCPDIALYLLNENTNEWEKIDTPERNPAGDTADECSYIVHPEHFSRFAIGGVTGTITNVSTRPGGGGSRTVNVDGTFSDSYFAINPLARIGVTRNTFAAPNGQVDSEFAVGEQVQISTTIRNYQQGPQTYAFIVQILDENGMVQSISWQTGMLDRGQEYTVGQSWLAEAAGDYQVRIFVWNGLTVPDPLSSVEVRMLQVSETGPIQSA